ncbi:cutinase family protein [Gordonia paraffinivorans]|uniref:cutinase family protein n=1 Tax=Gordonia paraffinivorans TaxID=175628 RepID=UPI001FFA056A|nr:cutinase family protein [Gordonia paraffinivorans]
MATGIIGTGVGVANAEAPITTFNLFIPGTWETDADADPTRPTGALAAVAREIEREHGDSATIYFLPYMARAFDNGRTYADSKATAIANASKVLAARAEADPDLRFTITGYSQGADAAGDLAAAIGNGEGPVPADRVVAVGLLADPGNGTEGQRTVGPTARGIGIADPRPEGMGELSGRVTSICHRADLYCSIDKRRHPVLGRIGTVLSEGAEDVADAVENAIDVIGTIARMNYAALSADIRRLPLLIAVGDLKAAHRVAGSVTLRLRPFVKLANKVDYGRVARVLDLIPDETGIAEVGAAMCRILDRVDLERAADLLGEIQELTWSAAGAAGARLGAASLPDTDIDVADVVDVGRKLVSLTVDTARDPDEGDDAHTGLLSELISPRFKELAKDLTRIVAKQAITDPSAIIRDAVTAKEFYSGHAHTDYARFVVDELGRTAIAWLGDWLAESIDAAADVPKRAAPR